MEVPGLTRSFPADFDQMLAALMLRRLSFLLTGLVLPGTLNPEA